MEDLHQNYDNDWERVEKLDRAMRSSIPHPGRRKIFGLYWHSSCSSGLHNIEVIRYNITSTEKNERRTDLHGKGPIQEEADERAHQLSQTCKLKIMLGI
jgi:hypothetical protein